MSFDAHTNLASGLVSVAPSSPTAGTSVTIIKDSGATLPATPFNATVAPVATLPTAAVAEIWRVTNVVGNVWTIVRAQEGTTARTVLVGDQVFVGVTAKTLTDIETAITALGTIDAAANVGSLRTVGIGALQATSGEDVRVSSPPRMLYPPPASLKVISAFQGNETWTKSGAGTQTFDTADFEVPPQSLKFVTDGAAGSGFSATVLGSPIDLSAQTLVISLKVDDFTKFGSMQVRIGSGGDTNTNYWYCQPAYTSATQRWVRQGEWWRITIPMTAHDLFTGGWKQVGTGPTLTAINKIMFKFADLGAGACTFHVGFLGYQALPASPICSIDFDDGRASQWTTAVSKLQQYGIRAGFNIIIENLDTSPYLSTAQVYSMRNLGHEIACHAYSNVAGAQVHSLGLDGVTSAQAETDLIEVKNWLYTNGMRGVNGLAIPHGSENVAGVNPNVLEQVRGLFDWSRNTFSTTLETYPPADPHRLRSYVASSTGGDTATTLLALVDDAITNGWWPIITFHDLVVTPSQSSDFSITQFGLFIDGIATRIAAGLVVKPIGEVLRSGPSPALQPLDSDLTAIAALTTTTFGRNLLTLANTAALLAAAGAAAATDLAAEVTRATTAEGLLAPLASPSFTGNPLVPTQTALTSNARAASTAYADAAVGVEKTRALAAEALLIPLTQRAAANGVATLGSGGQVPVAQLPTSTAGTIRDTVGAPVVITGDQAGDYAFDAGAGILYGPLVVISSLTNGHSWNTSLECSAASNGIAPNAFDLAGLIAGWKGESFPRREASIDQVTMVSGTAVAAWVYFAKGTVLSNLAFSLGGTGATGPTHSWMRLSDSSRVQLAVTADGGSTPITATFSTLTLAIATIAAGASSTFTTTYSGWHLVELVVVCTGTPPKLYGLPSNPPMNQAPGLGGTTDTGLAGGPPGFPHTASAITFIGSPLAHLGAS